MLLYAVKACRLLLADFRCFWKMSAARCSPAVVPWSASAWPFRPSASKDEPGALAASEKKHFGGEEQQASSVATVKSTLRVPRPSFVIFQEKCYSNIL